MLVCSTTVLFLLVSACLSQTAAAAAPSPRLSPIRTSSATSRNFFDEHGRVRIFHGAARVEKNPPWYFKDLVADSSEAEAMAALGFNVLRLGFSKAPCTHCQQPQRDRHCALMPGVCLGQCGRDTTLRLVFSTAPTSP